jgi:hypothetical protein
LIGPKKLSTIRDELRRALGAPDKDPIRELERWMSGDLKEGAPSIDDEVIRSLTRFLRTPAAPKRKAAARRAGRAPRRSLTALNAKQNSGTEDEGGVIRRDRSIS